MAYDISTISLNVSLGNTKEVESSFNALVKTLETKKIKLEVDTSSIRASLNMASQEIEKAYQSQLATKQKHDDASLRISKQSNAQAMAYLKQQQAEIQKTYGVDSKLTFNQNPDTKQITSAMISFTNEVGKAEAKMYKLNEDIVKFASSGEEVKSIKLAPVNEKVTSDLVKVNNELNKVIEGSQKVSDTMTNKMSNVTLGNEWVKSLESFKSFSVMLKAFDPTSVKMLKEDSYDLAQAWKLVQQEISKVKVGDKFASEFDKAQKALESFKSSMSNKIGNIKVGNDGQLASQLQVFEQLKTKFAELQGFRLTTTNIEDYIKLVGEVNLLYDQTNLKIKEVNTTSSQMTSSNKIDTELTNKVRDYNTQLEIMAQKNKDVASNPLYQQIQNDVNALSQAKQPLNQLSTETNVIDNNMKKLSASMTQVGSMGGVFTKLGQSIKGAFSFISASMVFYKLANQIREIPNEIGKLDTSLTELQKTSDLTGISLKNFTSEAYKVGETLARTGKEVIDASSEFSKSGYGSDELLNLSRAALLLTNVGDGITDVSEAAGTLISAMKGFGIESSNVVSIVDKINAVSNSTASNFEDISFGLERMSGTLGMAGTSIDKTISMFTAVNEVLRNSEIVSSGINSVFMRMRGLSEDTGEAVDGLASKLKDVYDEVNINMTDESGQLRDTFDVLNDLAGIWDTLSVNRKQYIAQESAGTRQAKVFVSLMHQWDIVQKSINTSLNSTGSAMEESERYFNSIDGKISQLKSAWEQLATTTMSSETIKWFVEGLTGIVKFIDTAGGLIPILGSILGLVIAIKAQAISAAIGGMAMSLGNLTFAFQAVAGGAATLNEALLFLNLNPVVLGISAITLALGGGVMAWNKYKSSVAEAKKVQLELANANIEEAKSIEMLSKKYKEATGLKDNKEKKDALLSIQAELIDSYGIEAKNINLVNGSYQEQIGLLNELKNSKLEASKVAFNQNYNDTKQDMDKVVGKYLFTARESLNPFEDLSKQYKEAMERTNEMFGKNVVSKDFNGWMHFDVENAKEYEQVLEQLLLNLQQQGVYGGLRFNELTKQYNALTEAIDNYQLASDNKFGNMYKTDSSNIAKELGIEDLSNMTMEELNKFKSAFNKILSDPNLGDNAYAKYCLEVIKSLSLVNDATDSTSETVAKSLDEISSAFTTNLAKVSENLGDIQSLYSTFQTSLKNNKGKFVPFDINDIEAIREKFGSLGDVFNDFEATLTSQASTSEDVQKAFDNLTGTYLVASNVLDGLNTSNRDMVVSQLELQGVQNASQIVTKDLAIASEKLAQEGRVLSDVTAQEALEFINSANASDKAKQMLALYAIEKVNANGITLMTNGDIDNLINLISYLGGATTALYQYKAAKAALEEETKKGSVAGFHMLEHEEGNMKRAEEKAQDEIKKAIEDARNSVSNNMAKLTTPVMSQNGTKSSKDKSSQYIKSLYQSIVDSILSGGDDVEKAIAMTNAKIENAQIMGNVDLETEQTNKLAELFKQERDNQAKMGKELDVQLESMRKTLSDTGAFSGVDLKSLDNLQLDKLINGIDKKMQGVSDKEKTRLQGMKSIIEDVGDVYLSTMNKREELSVIWYQKENQRSKQLIDNVKSVYDNTISKLDSEMKNIELQKSLLSTDGQSNAAKADLQKLYELNASTLDKIVAKRKATEVAISALRKQGKKDESAEIQALLREYEDYEEARLNKIREIANARRQDSMNSISYELEGINSSKGYMQDLLSLTIDMLKQEINSNKEALREKYDDRKEHLDKIYNAEKDSRDKRLSLLKEEADAQKKALRKESDERSYQQDLAEKQKLVSDTQGKITELENDTSYTGIKKRKALEDELKKYKQDLTDFQYERDVKLQEEAIDTQLKLEEQKIQDQLDMLKDKYDKDVEMADNSYNKQVKEYDDMLKDQSKLKEKANALIAAKESSFYNQLREYSNKYTSSLNIEFENLWSNAYTGLEKYGNKQGDIISALETMTEKAIALNAELKNISNNTSYKDYIQDDKSTTNGNYEIQKPSSGSSSSDKYWTDDKYVGKDTQDERAEYRDEQLRKLISLGDQMKGVKDTNKIKSLKDQQASVASTIGAYLQNGIYYIMINNKKYPVRDAISVRHDGLLSGRIGDGLQPNETILKATKDEWVLTGNQMRNLEANVNNLMSGQQGGGKESLQVTLDMHDFAISQDSLPDFEKMLKKEVPIIIENIVRKRGR